jgi:hypothetical protein
LRFSISLLRHTRKSPDVKARSEQAIGPLDATPYRPSVKYHRITFRTEKVVVFLTMDFQLLLHIAERWGKLNERLRRAALRVVRLS